MKPMIMAIQVQITKFVDDAFPGFVECEFVDAEGQKHRIIDKIWCLSNENLDSSSIYPQPGFVRCEILERFRYGKARDLAKVTLLRPDRIESTNGLSEFVVFSSQLQPDPWPRSSVSDEQ